MCWIYLYIRIEHKYINHLFNKKIFKKTIYIIMDNYHILHLIGEGSFGKVYKGR